jgi:hypothetical protein
MATTTNYSWTTPDDTALVKDGAAAIRTLGSSADTTVKNLNPETTLGDIAYRSSSANVKTRLGIGSTGDVLTVAAGVPSWAALPPAGGMTLISEQSVSAVSSVTFSSIAQTYKQLYLVWSGIRASDNSSSFSTRLNNDSSAIYKAVFPAFDATNWTQQSADYTHIGSTDFPSFGLKGNSSLIRNDGVGFLIFDNYASTTKQKFVYGSYWFQDTPTGQKYAPYHGIYDTTTAISQIDIVRLSGAGTITNNNNSSIRLYGLS